MADTTVNTNDQESQTTTEPAGGNAQEQTNNESSSTNEQSNSNDERGGDELPEWARKQISKANNEAASYRVQLREVQDQFKDAKTEAELEAILKPLNDKLDQSESRTRDLERELVIYKHGLDEDLAEFITGNDPEAWEEQAKKLAERFASGSQNEQQPSHKGGLAGRNGGGAKNDVDPAATAKRIVARNRY